jgi:hypothetical protein
MVLNRLISDIDIRIKEVDTNTQSVEDRMYKALQEALMVLIDENQKKISSLVSAKAELSR